MTLPVKPPIDSQILSACERAIAAIYDGEDLRTVLKDIGLPRKRFYDVLNSTPELDAQYTRAKQCRAEEMANEIVEIADSEPDAQKARNRIDARKWFASKVLSKIYGDRLDVNVTQTVDIGQALADARARALRPMSDQLEMDDAQVVEFKEITEPSAHDKQSGDLAADGTQTPEQKPDGG
jgi:hypothetical protein